MFASCILIVCVNCFVIYIVYICKYCRPIRVEVDDAVIHSELWVDIFALYYRSVKLLIWYNYYVQILKFSVT